MSRRRAKFEFDGFLADGSVMSKYAQVRRNNFASNQLRKPYIDYSLPLGTVATSTAAPSMQPPVFGDWACPTPSCC